MKHMRVFAGMAGAVIAASTLTACSSGDDLETSCQKLQDLEESQQSITASPEDEGDETAEQVNEVITTWRDIRENADDDELASAMQAVEPVFSVVRAVATGDISDEEAFTQVEESTSDAEVQDAAEVISNKCDVQIL